MEKRHIEHFFETTAKIEDYEMFNYTLPITLIYKTMYNDGEHILREKFDLFHSDVDVLAALYFNGKILTPTDLYAATVFSSGGMTKVLKKLQNLEYISRKPSPTDKRSMLVQLEPKGEKVLLACLKELVRSKKEYFDVLSSEEKENLKQILKKLTLTLF